jgi:hypothetical protein
VKKSALFKKSGALQTVRHHIKALKTLLWSAAFPGIKKMQPNFLRVFQNGRQKHEVSL